MKELASCSSFQDNIDVGVILKIAISFDYVRVIKVHLYFEFSCELFDNTLLFYKFFFHHF